jgi:hypothetical protein
VKRLIQLHLDKRQTISLLLITILTLSTFTGIIAVLANVDPSEHSVTITSSQSYRTEITKTVYNPAIPPKLDLLLLEDETGSFGDDIAIMKGTPPSYTDGLAGYIWGNISLAVSDFQGAVAGFRDFSKYGWGSPGDWVYKRYADFTADKAAWLSGIMLLSASGGYDTPEAQLAALKSAADGSAWDSNMDGDTDDAEDTPAGENPSWRDDATKVIVLVTDANYHEYGDPEFLNDPNVVEVWPGPTYAATVAALNAEGIHVIILATSWSYSYYNQLATDTDGSVQLIESDSSDIVDAIMTALEEIVTDVWWTASGDSEIGVSLTPDVHDDVTGDTTVTFTEIINVPSGLAPGEYTKTVTFWANSYPEEGATLGTETITVTVEEEPIEIDIKPNSDPNGMNPKSKGSIPVAIITTDSFDATTVNPETVRFGPSAAEPNHKGYCGHVEDYDGDGDLDVIYHFKIQDTGIVKGDTSATLTGVTYGGVYVTGTDSVKTAGK